MMSRTPKPRNKNLTVPNALSLLRLLIVPFFAWTFLTGHTLIATALLVVSGLSDLFDGIIARRFNQVTELGKMLDPLADKVTQGVVAVCLGIRFPIVLPVLLIFVIKELAMLVCATILLKRKKRPSAAMWYGKAGTAMFYISVAAIVLMARFFFVPDPAFSVISYALLGATAVMMIYAAVRYAQIFRDILRSDDEAGEFNLSQEIRGKTAPAGQEGAGSDKT